MTLFSQASEAREGVFPVEKWSSLTKTIRVVAWVRRFVHNARRHVSGRDLSDELSFREISEAKAALLCQTQRDSFPDEFSALAVGKAVSKSSPLSKLTPFLSEDGLIRMRGRLQMSDLSADERHPVILPKGHLSMLIIRFQHRLMSHAGVDTMLTTLRNSYWIIGARRLAKSVKRECVSC